MKYNGKYYYKFYWDCGYAGTDGYEIEEHEHELSANELTEIARQHMEDNCQRSGGYTDPDTDEMVDEGYMSDPEDEDD